MNSARRGVLRKALNLRRTYQNRPTDSNEYWLQRCQREAQITDEQLDAFEAEIVAAGDRDGNFYIIKREPQAPRESA